MDDLVSAANIFFGDFVSIDEEINNFLVEETTPESIFIAKNLFQSLSNEAKDIVKEIIDAPDNFYLANGSFRKMKLSQILKKKYNNKKIFKIKQELSEFCQSF